MQAVKVSARSWVSGGIPAIRILTTALDLLSTVRTCFRPDSQWVRPFSRPDPTQNFRDESRILNWVDFCGGSSPRVDDPTKVNHARREVRRLRPSGLWGVACDG